MTVYFCGHFVDKSKVVISPDDRGFLFSDGVYEVVRAYQGRFFRLAEHFERLTHGLMELRIDGVDCQTLLTAAHRLLEENGLSAADATLYLQITRGVAPRKHQFPQPVVPPTIYMEARPFSPPAAAQLEGRSAVIVADQRWARCDIKSIGLLPNTLASQRAHEMGAFEAIFCRDGALLEGSHSSILFEKKGVLIFPPLTNYVLGSITRNVIFSLAAQLSIPTAVHPCYENELPEFGEILMAGTSVEIVPITSVNGKKIGDGTPGKLARALQAAFQEITR